MAKKKVLFFYPRFVEEYKALLEKNVPEAEFMICTNREEMEKYAPEAEIALVGMTFPQDVFKRMPKLEWIQALAAGVETYVQNAEQFKHIPVCRITGAFGKYMAEYVLAYVLYFCQNICSLGSDLRNQLIFKRILPFKGRFWGLRRAF